MEVLTLDRRTGCTYELDLVTDDLPPLGEVDLCISNAAITTTIAASHKMTREQWQRDIDVNLTGAFRVVQACLGGMRERRFGRIVFISSVAATSGLPGQAAYSASKAGLLGLAKTLAAENAGHGITVNTVLPGMVATEAVLGMPSDVLDRVVEGLPMTELVPPAEIAALVAFLAGDETGHITGQQIAVDGGADLRTDSLTRSGRARS
jgi:acetoacetyl-CoA reductase